MGDNIGGGLSALSAAIQSTHIFSEMSESPQEPFSETTQSSRIECKHYQSIFFKTKYKIIV